MNIRVDLNTPISDGMDLVFRSPVDCSQITGLVVYYKEGNNTCSKVFAFSDAHGNNVGDIDHLFAENVVVKVILDVTSGMAFVQNADTNAYIEKTFIKTINGKTPDENGNVEIEAGCLSTTAVNLLMDVLDAVQYHTNVSGKIEQLREALLAGGGSGDDSGDSGEDTPDEPTVTDDITVSSGVMTIVTVGSAIAVSDGAMTIA